MQAGLRLDSGESIRLQESCRGTAHQKVDGTARINHATLVTDQAFAIEAEAGPGAAEIDVGVDRSRAEDRVEAVELLIEVRVLHTGDVVHGQAFVAIDQA